MITAKELLEKGYQQGPLIGKILKDANDSNLTMEQVVAKWTIEPPVTKQELNQKEIPVEIALDAQTHDDVKTLRDVLKQIEIIRRVPVVKQMAIMPDTCPAGSQPGDIVVGGAIAVENAIIPGAHSADVCCSMFASFMEVDQSLSTKDMMDHLQAITHFGPGGRDTPINDYIVKVEPVFTQDNKFFTGLKDKVISHMGTQGDGNHFAYIGRFKFTDKILTELANYGYVFAVNNIRDANLVDKDLVVLVTHHGSRGVGAEVYKRGREVAIQQTNKKYKGIPASACWIDYDTDEGKEYWRALTMVERWTVKNHSIIHHVFRRATKLKWVFDMYNAHNFVWKNENTFYHGKGATPMFGQDIYTGKDGALGIIPLNMAKEILLVAGKGNPQYLSFAPHGAGRNHSRTAITAPFRDERGISSKLVSERLSELTKGLDIRWYTGTPDISESPIGYKDPDQVIASIEKYKLAEVWGKITPLGCIMAGASAEPYWKKKKCTR
jgi:tRNA-splicing ligase RtcB